VQLLPRANNSASFRGDPKIVQMLKVHIQLRAEQTHQTKPVIARFFRNYRQQNTNLHEVIGRVSSDLQT
jgi:hypothetical protein